jgi:hypothetical protein
MDWSIAVVVHKDEDVLNSTLLRSPVVREGRRILCQRNYPTVAKAYTAALRDCPDDILVFTHPDVYLPAGWSAAFEGSLDWLNRHDPEWGVLGLFGIARDGSGRGFAYSTGIGGFVGVPFAEPCEVRTLDEFVFVVRRSSGLTFDENIPGAQSQLCTTDLCLEAERRKLRSYALPCLALHNSNRWTHMPLRFWKCYLYMRHKWRAALPVQVPYVKLTVGCLPMVKNTVRSALRLKSRKHRMATRVSDPEALYVQLRENLLSVLGHASPHEAVDARPPHGILAVSPASQPREHTYLPTP